MEWEEELVLRTRFLKFDEKLLCNSMIEIVKNIKKYSKKHNVNIDVFCIPGNFIHISGKKDVKIQFIIKNNVLTIKSDILDGMFINITLKEYYYLIEYKNTKNYFVENNSLYFLNKKDISNFIKDILVFNKSF